MRTVEEHQAVVAALLPPLAEESVPLAAAHGRVLARDVAAAVALPGFDNSAMDGYAARWAEVRRRRAAPGPAARRRGHPGRAHRRRPPGAGHRAADHDRRPAARPAPTSSSPSSSPTAAPTSSRSATCPRPARHLRARGRGHRRRARSRCTAGRAARAPPSWAWPPPSASPRCPSAAVRGCWCSPPAASSWRPGEPLLPGQIYESNSAAAGRRRRGRRRRGPPAALRPRRRRPVPRDRARPSWRAADLLITSGGVSAGAYEVVKDAFAAWAPSSSPRSPCSRAARRAPAPSTASRW